MGRSLAAADLDEMLHWAVMSLGCPFCRDGPIGGIEARRTRIDCQCRSCGFVWSLNTPDVRALWRRPAYRTALGPRSETLTAIERGIRR